jgi:hypothetical protein
LRLIATWLAIWLGVAGFASYSWAESRVEPIVINYPPYNPNLFIGAETFERAKHPDRSRSFARSQMSKFGWDGKQFFCLEELWERESNWKHTADNPKSSAYGIPQALPGSKMASEGSDWATNPETQVRWGLKYISERYGNPCLAWNHFEKKNWY